MAKIKLTKNELKSQKDSLKRFERYLPTLMLKKQQLQLVIRQIDVEVNKKTADRETLYSSIQSWIAVYGEDVQLAQYLQISELVTGDGNIAGVDIPLFERIAFTEERYDLMAMPLWVDAGLSALKKLLTLDAEIEVLEQQREKLNDELRVTTQRVNLFEKVKIPEAKENIRNIRIYLGDQQTAAVVRGKIAKRNLVQEVVA
ncbi:MAG: V-type ATP synthase subunit D [Spirochaetales bacterium]|jgi:V/A-type H+/Na+-transporting ATPase subunit D|nr:V-type ATP synthase subunit D [Spirochaetales bacterium]